MEDDIGPVIEWALQVWRGKGVVDAEDRSGILSHLCDGRDVGYPQHRIGRRLQPHQSGVGPNRTLNRFQIGRIGNAPLEPLLSEHAGKEPKGPAVGIVGQEHVVAGAQQIAHQGRGRHPGGRRHRSAARSLGHTLQRGKRVLERGSGGVVGAGVLVTGVFSRGILGVGRCGVDGNHHRTGGRIRILARMDCPRLEPHDPSSPKPCSAIHSSLKIFDR